MHLRTWTTLLLGCASLACGDSDATGTPDARACVGYGLAYDD